MPIVEGFKFHEEKELIDLTLIFKLQQNMAL